MHFFALGCTPMHQITCKKPAIFTLWQRLSFTSTYDSMIYAPASRFAGRLSYNPEDVNVASISNNEEHTNAATECFQVTIEKGCRAAASLDQLARRRI